MEKGNADGRGSKAQGKGEKTHSERSRGQGRHDVGLGWILMLLFFLVVIPSTASALRCHGRIVSPGDTAYEVISKCGEPTRVEVRDPEWVEGWVLRFPLFSWWILKKERTEEWTYDFGPHRLIYYLRFQEGILKEIRTGDYGTP